MNAHELRNGNWLHSELTNKDFQVNPDDIRSIWLGYDRGMVKPIPLTEEWLLKFGFRTRTTTGHSVQYFIGFNPITHDWLFDILWLNGDSVPFYKNVFHKINYVHQLQNLYFALTWEELKLKHD